MTIGVIGTGRIGTSHARMLTSLTDKVIVADLDLASAEAAAAALGVEAAGSIEDLIEGSDGIVIAAATPAHADLIVAGVDAGIPVFCEKPIALDLGTTKRVVRHVVENEVAVQIGFQRRFDQGYMEARRLVESGSMGTLLAVRMIGHDPAPPPESYIPESGGLFRDFSIHDFDALRFVTGQEVVEVYATGSVREFPAFARHGDVDTGAVVATLDSGLVASMTWTRSHPWGYDVRMEVVGTDDCGIVGLDARAPLRSLEPNEGGRPPQVYGGFLERFDRAYRDELAAFVEIVKGRDREVPTVQDAEAAMLVAVACDFSREARRPVAVEEVAHG